MAAYKLSDGLLYYKEVNLVDSKSKEIAKSQLHLYENSNRTAEDYKSKKLLFPPTDSLIQIDEVPLYLFKIYNIESTFDPDEYLNRLIHANLKLRQLKEEYIRSIKKSDNMAFQTDGVRVKRQQYKRIIPLGGQDKQSLSQSHTNNTSLFRKSVHRRLDSNSGRYYSSNKEKVTYVLKERNSVQREDSFLNLLRKKQSSIFRDSEGRPIRIVIHIKKVLAFIVSEKIIVYSLFGIMAIVLIIAASKKID